MEARKGRPEITPGDHPMTVYNALLASHALWYAEQGEAVGFAWTKTAQDARGALRDGFSIINPEKGPLSLDRKALLFMSPDELEYALVGYGCELIDSDKGSNAAEISYVDELLRSIDKIRA